MIEKLILIHNYGKFKHFDIAMSDWDGTFKKTNVIYAPNGSGKTTLALLFNSLSGNNELLLKKKSFGSKIAPEIKFMSGKKELKYTNNKWNRFVPCIEVFNSFYIDENTYTITIEDDMSKPNDENGKNSKGGINLNSIFRYKEINGEVIITGLKEGVVTTSIVIPETIEGIPVIGIGSKAFKSTSITDIKIGENIRKIGKQAFYKCKKLSSVTWSHKCDVIPADCFFECSNLTQFDFSDIKKVDRAAFYESGLKEVCLPENIEVVSGWAFFECKKLSSVIWNCKCDVIPAYCFVGCSNLTQFDFTNIKRIETRAFRGSGLTSVTLNKETAVEQCCFVQCNDLKKVEWLSDQNIEGDIFEECKNIKEIFISDKVKNIEVSAFAFSPNAEITFV